MEHTVATSDQFGLLISRTITDNISTRLGVGVMAAACGRHRRRLPLDPMTRLLQQLLLLMLIVMSHRVDCRSLPLSEPPTEQQTVSQLLTLHRLEQAQWTVM